jgi:hypothetical protein
MAGIPRGDAGGDDGLGGPRSFNNEIATAHSASVDGIDDMLGFSTEVLVLGLPHSQIDEVTSATPR